MPAAATRGPTTPLSASASVDLEAQIQRAANADVWINGGGWKSLPAMLDDEPRYAAFKAYRQGQVWVYERRQTPTGANDYWSRSVTHPDLAARRPRQDLPSAARRPSTRSSGTCRCRSGSGMTKREAVMLAALVVGVDRRVPAVARARVDVHSACAAWSWRCWHPSAERDSVVDGRDHASGCRDR